MGSITTILTAVGQTGNFLWDPMKKTCRYIKQYSRNVHKVKIDVEKLQKEFHELDNDVNLEKGGQERTAKAESWLIEARSLLDDKKVKEINELKGDQCDQNDQNDQNECFGRDLCHCRGPNRLVNRYKRSKLAEEQLQKINELLTTVPKSSERTRPKSDATGKDKIAEYFNMPASNSRQDLMDQISNKLRHGQVSVVGLWGDKSVGKTRMAKDIMKDPRVKAEFQGRIALVDVSETPNKKVIQDKIVDVTDKSLKDWDHVALRAFLLQIYFEMHHERKILIILDHIWGKLDLKALGICPENCKVLVVSREKDVCNAMDAKDDNIYEMKPLDQDEAKRLFWTQVYHDKEKMIDQAVTSWDYLHFGDTLLKDYCHGIPGAIIALAKLLRDQNLHQWKRFAEADLATSRHDAIHSIWQYNIRLLDDNKDKKRFFLLTFLFSQELSIPIQELVRYAMGLDLIQWVNNLTEAISQANTWVHELISLSLLEADENSTSNNRLLKVVIHHFVREHANSLLIEEKNKLLVKSIPRWHTVKSCQEYTAISLMHGSDHSLLDGLYSSKLEMLLLNHSKPEAQFSDDFFEWMLNLKILVLKGMTMKPNVPSSINKLLEKGLRLLSLEECKLGKFSINTKKVNLVVNLVVLSFRGSTMEELPVELVRKCHVLRLLDLSKCKINNGIPADVLNKLSQLEGLYAYDSFDNWASDNHEMESATKKSDYSEIYASVSELNYLKHLNVLKMNLQHLKQWPIQGEDIIRKLNQFHICVGSHQDLAETVEGFCRILQLQSIDASSITNCGWLKELLEKSEMVKVEGMAELQQFIHETDFMFRYLQNLVITECSQMQFLSSTAFQAPNLVELKVEACASLNHFFKELKGKPIKFYNLKVMQLHDLQNLKSVLAESNCSTTSNEPQGGQEHEQDQHFFHKKIIFPMLEILDIKNMGQIVQLWDVKYDDITSFKNLKKILIRECDKLEALASLSIAAALTELTELTITDCPRIREVITTMETKDEKQIIFPVLNKITLERCPNLQVFLSGNQNQDLELMKSLHTLKINDCPNIMSLSSGKFKAPDTCKVTIDDSSHENGEINSFLRNHFQNLLKQSEGSTGKQSKGEESRINRSEIQESTC